MVCPGLRSGVSEFGVPFHFILARLFLSYLREGFRYDCSQRGAPQGAGWNACNAVHRFSKLHQPAESNRVIFVIERRRVYPRRTVIQETFSLFGALAQLHRHQAPRSTSNWTATIDHSHSAADRRMRVGRADDGYMYLEVVSPRRGPPNDGSFPQVLKNPLH